MYLRRILGLSGLFIAINSLAAGSCPQNSEKLLTRAPLKPVAIPITELRSDYRARTADGSYRIQNAEKLEFDGTDGRDVYNPTALFKTRFRGKEVEVLLGRTEEPLKETGTESIFYAHSGKTWEAVPGAPKFQMQDPFFTHIGKELVVGGVETFDKGDGTLGYRTVFFRDHGQGIEHLVRFAEGPNGMKDIRILSLGDGQILVLTRPQGDVGGRGKIGITTVKSLDELNADVLTAAPLLEGQFAEGEWGGANAAYLLPGGNVGVLGHIARYDEKGNRNYFPAAFVYNPKTKTATPMKIILERAALPGGLGGKTKRNKDDLRDVLFSGGLIRHADGTATLYVGAGDAEVWRVTIPDPFL